MGSGDFVYQVISNVHRIDYPKIVKRIPLPELVARISKFLKAEKNEVLLGNRKQINCHARMSPITTEVSDQKPEIRGKHLKIIACI